MSQRKASLAARLVISDYIAFILKSLTHKFTTYIYAMQLLADIFNAQLFSKTRSA